MKTEPYKSKVYTDRPPYADFDAPAKFTAKTCRNIETMLHSRRNTIFWQNSATTLAQKKCS